MNPYLYHFDTDTYPNDQRFEVWRDEVNAIFDVGNSTATNYGAALSGLGGTAGGGLSGFSKTPEGKATVAAFIDAYNKMVVALRSYKAQDVKGGLGRGGQLQVN